MERIREAVTAAAHWLRYKRVGSWSVAQLITYLFFVGTVVFVLLRDDDQTQDIRRLAEQTEVLSQDNAVLIERLCASGMEEREALTDFIELMTTPPDGPPPTFSDPQTQAAAERLRALRDQLRDYGRDLADDPIIC